MSIEVQIIAVNSSVEEDVSCANCKACCCRLEVFLMTDTGVPERLVDVDQWGSETMRRSDDGWCVALDRNTLMCSIYENRPLVCREFEMGEAECLTERKAHM
jgi:Fe-S-cluster containining protein